MRVIRLQWGKMSTSWNSYCSFWAKKSLTCICCLLTFPFLLHSFVRHGNLLANELLVQVPKGKSLFHRCKEKPHPKSTLSMITSDRNAWTGIYSPQAVCTQRVENVSVDLGIYQHSALGWTDFLKWGAEIQLGSSFSTTQNWTQRSPEWKINVNESF